MNIHVYSPTNVATYTKPMEHFKWKALKRDGAKKSVSLRPKAVMLTPMIDEY